MKKVLKVSAIVLACIVLVCAAFVFGFFNMIANIQKAYDSIEPLKLEEIPDGVYRGKGGTFIVAAELEVTVTDHRISGIQVVNQICSSDHKALEAVTRILDGQTAKVDDITGATWSGRSIMAATYDALQAE